MDVTPLLVEILQREPHRFSKLSPDQFELLIADRREAMGYAIQKIKGTTLKDGGIDLIGAPKIADVGGFLLAVQVKHH